MKYHPEEMDRPLTILGLTQRNVEEFSAHNMGCFNEVAKDGEGVSYFSMGA